MVNMAMVQYKDTLCDSQGRVTHIPISSDIHHFFVVRMFRIFWLFPNACHVVVSCGHSTVLQNTRLCSLTSLLSASPQPLVTTNFR